jgi:hypothetical protein
MVILSGIIIALQVSILAMALFYARPKAVVYPDKGYGMWKLLAFSALIPLGLALFTFASIRSLSMPIFMTLSVEALALDQLAMSLFYWRPRYFADKAATRLGTWKLLTILSVIIACTGLLIPIVFML